LLIDRDTHLWPLSTATLRAGAPPGGVTSPPAAAPSPLAATVLSAALMDVVRPAVGGASSRLVELQEAQVRLVALGR
jgi:hypothetical protein